MKAIRLQTEYLINPCGIDKTSPRLFWNCEDGVKQTAYQIIAVSETGEILWDTQKQISDKMQAKWAGKPLTSRSHVKWTVRLWNENDQSGEISEEAIFEIGLLDQNDWKASWITADLQVNKKERYPVDSFKRNFVVTDLKKARLYITACGIYEAKINGQRVGDFILAPGITDYKRRIQVQTYDVTNLLQQGDNEITVELADGWYRGSVGAWGIRNEYGTVTKLLAQLELTDSNDKTELVCTDSTWSWSNDGPIRFADNKDGEIVEAFKTPSYSKKAKQVEFSVKLASSNNVSIKEQEHFLPELIITPLNQKVLDFKQNHAGYVSFKVEAKQGQKIILRFGELLDEDGEFTQKNIQCKNKKITTPLQQVIYNCKEGINEYKTKFAIFGYRYVQVETDVKFDPEQFVSIAVYSNMEQTSKFESSNELLNQFYKNTVWSAKSNSCDLPTDCPTRERHGWTGDAQIFCKTASVLFNYMPFAQKYIVDMYDWQKKNGCLPQIVPEGGVDSYMKAMDGSVGWADAGVLMPYVLWKTYGDTEILERHYHQMQSYAKFMQNRCGRWYPTAKRIKLDRETKKYISNFGQAYGEWAEPADVHVMSWVDCAIPHPEVATAYTAHIMDCMAEIADELGKIHDAEGYREFSKKCKKSYQALMTTEKYLIDTDRQAHLVRGLAFDVLSDSQKEFAEKRLIQALNNYGWRLGTGFLSTPLILDVLTKIDIEYAYRLLENEEMPGWLFMPKNGATTVWEAWEGTKAQNGIASLNHYSKGAVCKWLFDTMCGIKVETENMFVIEPKPGGHFSYASSEILSVYGLIKSKWQKTDSGFEYTISVPSNCTAKIILENGEPIIQQAGEKTYSIGFKQKERS